MKKTIYIGLLLVTLTAFLCGCSQNGAETASVTLCDYHNLVIDESEYYVSEADLNAAIEMHLNALDAEADSVQLTDETARQYFNANTKEEAVANIKREMIENRFCEAAIPVILTTSYAKIVPNESEAFVASVLNMQKKTAEEMGIEQDEYFNRFFDMTEREYRQALLDEYANYKIISALAQKEGYTISDTERLACIEEIAHNDGITEAEAVDRYGSVYFDLILYENFLKAYLTDVYRSQIEEAVTCK